ncbi:MAG: hypothetical protein HY878_03270 [Deltaproteobacteria bacterium]|nr:hypothetical protein [Deltaproteobacteria bacterium]
MKGLSLFAILTIILGTWLLALPVYAQQDTIILAIRLLDEYSKGQEELLTHLAEESSEPTKDAIKGVIERVSKGKEKTSNNLKDLRWLESSSVRQVKRARRLVEGYTNDHIKALKELAGKVPGEDKKKVEGILERSVASRNKVINRLKEEERAATAPTWEETPASPIDVSPIEEEPAKGRGIWER